MGINRRDFLKIAGLSTIMGLGGKAAFELLAPGELGAQDVPLTVGKKWGMVVDMTKMEDEVIDKCIEACHRLHNVPNLGNPKEEIKWIWKETFEHTFPGQGHEYIAEEIKERNFPLLCNHCTNPPCCRACPTKATWKREDGVVMMDQHRCIGCRFCMAACPFGARSFNWNPPRPFIEEINPDFPTRTKGVVEKCNFCEERLAQGLLPACVEACSEKALLFGDLEDPDSGVREILRSQHVIQRLPELGTKPSVYYVD